MLFKKQIYDKKKDEKKYEDLFLKQQKIDNKHTLIWLVLLLLLFAIYCSIILVGT